MHQQPDYFIQLSTEEKVQRSVLLYANSRIDEGRGTMVEDEMIQLQSIQLPSKSINQELGMIQR